MSYVNITESEMDAFLTPMGFQPVTIPNCGEKVYSKLLLKTPTPLCVRVYSSITGGAAKGVGEDAIRCVLVTKVSDQIRTVGRTRRVNRTTNWRKNLNERLESWNTFVGPSCPICGGFTVERKGKFGPFFGCANYPACKGIVKDCDKKPE